MSIVHLFVFVYIVISGDRWPWKLELGKQNKVMEYAVLACTRSQPAHLPDPCDSQSQWFAMLAKARECPIDWEQWAGSMEVGDNDICRFLL